MTYQDYIELHALLHEVETICACDKGDGWVLVSMTVQEFEALERLLRQHLAVPAPVEGVPV